MSPYTVLAIGTVAWFSPLVSHWRPLRAGATVNRRGRWGLLLVAAGYGVSWQAAFWVKPAGGWRLALAAACLAVACGFSWTAGRALGRRWRLEAAVDADHELVRSGVYAVVRHPIYTSMLLVVAATGLILSPLYLLPVSLLLYVVGTELRVRAEESLLAGRFGEAFQAYRRQVPAYLPALRRRGRRASPR